MKLYAPKQNQWKALFLALLLCVSGLVSCGGEDTAAPEAEGETIAEIVAETEEETAYAGVSGVLYLQSAIAGVMVGPGCPVDGAALYKWC